MNKVAWRLVRATSAAFGVLLLDGKPDVTAFLGVLESAGEEVRHDLFNAGRVGIQPNRVTAIPTLYWPLLGLTLLCYVVLTQLVKMWLLRRKWI